ncbi:rhamnan synthesis F family protein [Streptococcus sp. DD12]|uniref:rhamnan synthesis F family protein n=1 Tax=Streptococcus sp. DD12 TaxID=1777880 RepID=UPI0007969F5C|nr:rhamnan synthesis F family protein [Streptococcus sp. DD12]KXT76906.1 Alpha-L-Rha alpha-1,2-L-rhamnosyltransferase/alpha-L-Rha alpha-1,3-L- rhamnosyltransferase [Streptococcus sp. DD12]
MKRLLLYVHFNRYNSLSDHVLYQLEQMNPLFSRIVFISNSQLDEAAINTLRERRLIDEVVQRKNSGFDFGAWRDGMDAVGWEQLKNFDSLTIMNDTCFGPLWDMLPIYQKFEEDNTVDFWGLTNHRAQGKMKEHLQSYFISFKKEVVLSPAFPHFWLNVQDFDDVQDVIDHYETQVTTTFEEEGFRYRAVFDTVDEPTDHMPHPDFSFYNTSAILQHGVPFIKVKPLNAIPEYTVAVLDFIQKNSDYPTELILRHMSKVFPNTENYLLAYKYAQMAPASPSPKAKVAIHLHVFYTDLLASFLEIFATYDFAYDLYITTDSKKKVPTIEEVLNLYNAQAAIHVTGNVGRDVLPMLKLKKELSQYDYVGHFHTKKSKEADFWAGESWRNDLVDMLVRPAGSLLAQLEKSPDLGLVIADIPTYFRFVKLDPAHEAMIEPMMTKMWKEMGMTKVIDFKAYSTYVMSYGTFIWFKYDALKPLFDLDLTEEQVPAEPLPQGSILHAIERMMVYIAWGQDYDFIIAPHPKRLAPYIDVNLLNTKPSNTFYPWAPIEFTQFGGLKGSVKFFFHANFGILKYVTKRVLAPALRIYHKVMPFN